METRFKSVHCPIRKHTLICFSSKAEADHFILYNQQTGTTGPDDKPLHAYYCPACAGWHLTHKLQSNSGDTDAQFNVLFNLEQLINDLKANFDAEQWKIWQPRLNEAQTWISRLDEEGQYGHLLVEAKRQLVHYDHIVRGKLQKFTRKTGRIRNLLNAEIKGVSQCLQTYEVADCDRHIKMMSRLVSESEWFTQLEQEMQDDCNRIISNLSDDHVISKLSQTGNLLKTIRVGIDMLPMEQLETLYAKLSGLLNDLEPYGLHTLVVKPFQHGIDQFRKKIEGRGTGYKDPKTGVDHRLATIQKTYGRCRLLLDDVAQKLLADKPTEALYCLQRVDERLRNIPLCKDKAEILQRMLDLTFRCV